MVLSAFLGGGIVVLESFKIQVLASHFVKKPAVDFVVLRIKSVKQLLNQMYIGVLLISRELSEIPCGWLRNLLALYDWDGTSLVVMVRFLKKSAVRLCRGFNAIL